MKSKQNNYANSSLNAFVERWETLVLRFRSVVIAASILTAIGLVSTTKMIFDADYHSFSSESTPELEAFEAPQEKFTQDGSEVIVLNDKDQNSFTREN